MKKEGCKEKDTFQVVRYGRYLQYNKSVIQEKDLEKKRLYLSLLRKNCLGQKIRQF
jgi:hypothetical protein